MSSQADEQTDELKKLVEQVEKKEGPSQTTEPSNVNKETMELAAAKEIDVLNLPPRSEVHRDGKKRTRITISTPLIRLFIVFLVILAVLGGLYYGWEKDLLDFNYIDNVLKNPL